MPIAQVPDSWKKPISADTVWTEVMLSEAAIGEYERAYPGKIRVDPEYARAAKLKRLKMMASAADRDAEAAAAQAAQAKAALELAITEAEAEGKPLKVAKVAKKGAADE